MRSVVTTQLVRAVGLHRLPPLMHRSMSLWHPPRFENEKTLNYEKGSPERIELTQALQKLKRKGQLETRQSCKQENPSRHREIVAEYATATPEQANAAVDAALRAKPAWEAMPFEDRASIFLRASELIVGKYRSELVAATMLGQAAQGPTGRHLEQAGVPSLEGFVYAIAPFNFTALGATLIGPAALLGNVVIWKPSDSALHSSWLLHQILLEAGLPKDVIQFLPGDAEEVTNTLLQRPEFGALTFIGSTQVFKGLQKKVGNGIGDGLYNSYPRIIGETGGKNWGLVHPSANIRNAALNTIRAAFEYQGQKCSANSRVYVAESVWPEFRRHLQEELAQVSVGPVDEYRHFINPVIHRRAFDRLAQVIEAAKQDPELELIAGGQSSNDEGYYVHPTVYRTTNPRHEIMSRELFGPILGVYVYPDDEWESTLGLVDTTSRYALTGSIFAKDIYASRQAQTGAEARSGHALHQHQMHGIHGSPATIWSSRDSGTNDKTGTMAHLQRFISVRTIKEDFGTLDRVQYPSNE
ncbi:uncharacterized protein ATNIH1004_008348 [Aspergillus tanneri]|uniref:L-glutamate gamma-semialdehyde dehydrogenase n=1 Tax=Aspergillus tanneri TaxID=1220188 RepID=A0A5M9MI59_9EURO|nr:uncharacterized protein ATNIH1004_008348 [Aspergillus tanneri]KAA8644149.1 hypothetical protein ATNIH1004_008348 [Aspergillus tanneri]